MLGIIPNKKKKPKPPFLIIQQYTQIKFRNYKALVLDLVLDFQIKKENIILCNLFVLGCILRRGNSDFLRTVKIT